MATAQLQLRFWGVRGSTPTPQSENLKFGGNTACVEIRTPGNESVIFDAGTGIRNLGKLLTEESAGQPMRTQIFLTHFHWDHIQGIPFFAPLYCRKNEVCFHAGHHELPMQEILEGQMVKPYFPVDFSQVAARQEFNEFNRCQALEISGMTVRPFPLNHPQGATGYRVEAGGSVIVYATDYEHGHPELDRVLLEHAKGADILICDTQYTPEEYEKHKGWGHSTWLNAAQVAVEAGAKRLILFHHDPDHEDQTMQEITGDARRHFENTTAAWEGFTAAV